MVCVNVLGIWYGKMACVVFVLRALASVETHVNLVLETTGRMPKGCALPVLIRKQGPRVFVIYVGEMKDLRMEFALNV